MARYIGPKIKISRRYGVKLGLRTNEEAFTRRPHRPGVHGPKGRRGRPSEYATQLHEKQKAKYIYGILERQFRRYYEQATKSNNIGVTLLQLLETRLDTVVYRAGLALTQNQARQFVSHMHVTVDGKRVNIPSFQVHPDMLISVDKDLVELIDSQRGMSIELPTWLRRSGASAVEVLAVPVRDQITSLLEEQLIVEHYSR